MKIQYNGKDTLINGVSPFSLRQTLDCGQCFRWDEIEENTFVGVVKNTVCKISQIDDTIVFFDTDEKTFERLWKNYFDFELDYNAIRDEICKDEIMKKAGDYASGIRILKQDAWETICSFIISQNNNIKRIKGIVKRLCMEQNNFLLAGTHVQHLTAETGRSGSGGVAAVRILGGGERRSTAAAGSGLYGLFLVSIHFLFVIIIILIGIRLGKFLYIVPKTHVYISSYYVRK